MTLGELDYEIRIEGSRGSKSYFATKPVAGN